MREIVLDTETTGLDPATGDRIVEIGCVELDNHIPSGNTFHVYINPERRMPKAAFDVHGLSDEFLADKPKFADIAADFAAFIRDARLIIHNASFDIGFLNAELTRAKFEPIPLHAVVDTLDLARRKHPGAQNSLDALCNRYGVDSSHRHLHGALLDADLLALVYIELIGGRQAAFELTDNGTTGVGIVNAASPNPRPHPLPSRLTAEDLEAHRAFVAGLGDEPVWARFDPEIKTAPAD